MLDMQMTCSDRQILAPSLIAPEKRKAMPIKTLPLQESTLWCCQYSYEIVIIVDIAE